MLEARLPQAQVLKRIVEVLKELVSDANFDCNESGISLHGDGYLARCTICPCRLRPEGFDPYRCDRSMSLGINLASLGKFLRCAGNEDVLTLRAQDSDILTLVFENSSEWERDLGHTGQRCRHHHNTNLCAAYKIRQGQSL